MRTNIEIDDSLMAQALKAGPYKTKKEAVEAGLKLLARQVAYREILKWRGKLKWEGDESIDWPAENRADLARSALAAREPSLPWPASDAGATAPAAPAAKPATRPATKPAPKARRAGR
jgi:antitoxin ParD1/3/4